MNIKLRQRKSDPDSEKPPDSGPEVQPTTANPRQFNGAFARVKRTKAGGLQAAQAAGRVVTRATLRLAQLYAEERPTPGARTDRPRGASPEVQPVGKAVIEEAARMARKDLSALRPILDAPKPAVAQAQRAIEARGDVVTPSALLREVIATSSRKVLGELCPPCPPLGGFRRLLAAYKTANLSINIDVGADPCQLEVLAP